MKTLPLLLVSDCEHNILLLHRKDRQTREPIKGGIEPWETPVQAIIRECYEETGLSIAKSDITKIYEIISNELQKNVYMISLSDFKPSVSINHVIEWWEDHDNYNRFSLSDLDNLSIDYKEEFMMYIDKSLIFNS